MPAPAFESYDDRRRFLSDTVNVCGVDVACIVEAVPIALGEGHAPGQVVPVRLICANEDAASVENGDAVGPINGVSYTIADVAPDGTGMATLTLTAE